MKSRLQQFTPYLRLTEPDRTFYENIKGVTLEDRQVVDPPASKLPLPPLLHLSAALKRSWQQVHAPLIEAAFFNRRLNTAYRTIFPGPFIPTLNTEMTEIGDFAFSVFENILKSIKQRIPFPRHLKKNSYRYSYRSRYRPITRLITEPEEGWMYPKIKCPVVEGINFPLPPTYEFEPEDRERYDKVLTLIQTRCRRFCQQYVGKGKKRTLHDIEATVSFIQAVEYLFDLPFSPLIGRAFHEVLRHFDRLDTQPQNPALFLFEIEHALSYLTAIARYPLLASGPHNFFWVDILQLPLEQLMETELGDIERVLREIRTFFSLGWSPIIVHLDGNIAFNIDGTHRHYALLTIELLRRLKKAAGGIPIRKINLHADISHQAVQEFKRRYKKEGLSLRETLRVVNTLVNSDIPWPYLDGLEMELEQVLDLEFKYVPVIHLPEWRARAVVKNLCDKGIALVGVPPENIYLVGRSRGKKGIFIRGGYHGTDRQPLPWMDIVELQKQ